MSDGNGNGKGVKAKPAAAPAEPATAAGRLVGLLGTLTADDLKELDGQIAAKRAEIDRLLAGHRDELAGLVTARALVAKRLGLEEPKRKPGPRKKADGVTPAPAGGKGDLRRERQARVARLLGVRGPTPATTIANELEIPLGSITSVLDGPWFMPGPSGYQLTAAGRQEFIAAATTAR